VVALRETLDELAPVADVQARLVASLDTTFGAFASVARPYIQDAIAKSPPTLDTAVSSLPTIRPFLTHGATLFETLRPGTLSLRQTAPTLARAVVDGIPALRASPSLNAELDPTAQSLLEFSQDGGVRRGLEQLTRLSSILTPTLRFVTPAQSVCNYATLLGRNGASLLSLGDGVGTWQRFINFDVPKGENSEGSPTPRLRGRRGSARPATSPTSAASRSSATFPATRGPRPRTRPSRRPAAGARERGRGADAAARTPAPAAVALPARHIDPQPGDRGSDRRGRDRDPGAARVHPGQPVHG
jgi:hypothetical protein